MANDFRLTVGQAHELEMAMNRVGGWDGALVKALSTGDRLSELREVLLGRSEIKPIEHLIDCDADPFCPEGWKVEEHRKGGKVRWAKDLVQLYLSESQKSGKVIRGDDLRKELVGKPTLNANVLDFLLANPRLIPEEWKGKAVFFWGTVYRGPGGASLSVASIGTAAGGSGTATGLMAAGMMVAPWLCRQVSSSPWFLDYLILVLGSSAFCPFGPCEKLSQGFFVEK